MDSLYPGLYLQFLNLTGVSGVMYPDETNLFWKIYKYIFIGLLVFIYPSTTIFTILTFQLYDNDFESIIALIFYYTPVFLISTKALYILYQNKSLKEIMSVFKIDYLKCIKYNSNSTQLFKDTLKRTNIMSYVWSYSMYINIFVWITRPIFVVILSSKSYQSPNELPTVLPIKYPFSVNNWMIYSLTQFYEVCITYVNILNMITMDLIIFTTISVYCGQMEILKHNLLILKHGNENPENKNQGSITDERLIIPDKKKCEMNEKLSDCIEDHKKLLLLKNDMQLLFNPLLTIQLTMSISFLLLVAIQIVQATTPAEYYRCAAYSLSSLAQIFVYCWQSSRLIHCSESISNAAYSTDWVTNSKSFTQATQLLIMRSQTPVTMKAWWGVVTVDFETFINVLRVTYSYYTVLRQVSSK